MYVTLPTAADPVGLRPQDPAGVQQSCPQQRLRKVARGTCLYREGDAADQLFEVVSGVLRLTRVLENGRRQVIAFGLPGDILGFPKGTRHQAECDVIDDAVVVAHRRSMLETGTGDPELHRRLLLAALREIAAMQDHFLMLARKSAMEKVASFLITVAARSQVRIGNHACISLPMSRADIADFLGLTIETVCRMITRLRQSGIIRLETAQSVLVLDMDALTEAAQAPD
jgi:CRP/FNR family transcriptional regulator/CRP/FNR family nitrogen fixation transcriptional regulator